MVKKARSQTIKATIKEGKAYLGISPKKRTGTIQQTLNDAKNIVKKRATKTMKAVVKEGKAFLNKPAAKPKKATKTASKKISKAKTAKAAKKPAARKATKKWYDLPIIILLMSV